MTPKAIKCLFTLFFFALLSTSCINQKFGSGTKTDIYDRKDSLASLEKIQAIKHLDFTVFTEKKFRSEGEVMKYRFLKPEKTEPNKQYPLVVVFHGSGAIGNDNKAQIGTLAKMWLTPENRSKYPVFVLAPQFPIRSSNYHLDDKRKVMASESNSYLQDVLKTIETLKTSENIDPNRIYVMGFSMGGATTSNAISLRPDLFAAAINIAGISQFDHIEDLTQLPIWMIHGSLDTDNAPQSNYAFYNELKDRSPIMFWDYKNKYHNNILSYELIQAIPKWLLKQKK